MTDSTDMITLLEASVLQDSLFDIHLPVLEKNSTNLEM